jgi:hypothetical protein
MNVSCGPKSQCKTSRCICKKNKEYCKPKCPTCNCNGEICSNVNSCDKYVESESNEDSNIEFSCNSSNCKEIGCKCKKSPTNFSDSCLNRNENEKKDEIKLNNEKCIKNESKGYELRSKLYNIEYSKTNNILPSNESKDLDISKKVEIVLKGCNCKLTFCRDERCGCRKMKNTCNSNCQCKNCTNVSVKIDKKEDRDHEDYFYKIDPAKNNESNQIEKAKYEKKTIEKIEAVNKNKFKNEQLEEILDINFIASLITEKIRKPNVSIIKEKVFKFRNEIDLYTLKNKEEVIDPDVDHIIEDQILGHATARALGNISFRKYVNPLKDALNLDTLENYNVTFNKINRSKGAIFKAYLQNNIYQGYPIRYLVNQDTIFAKHAEQILIIMNQTYPIVLEYLESPERKCDHNFVSGSGKFQEIATQFENIIKVMKLDLNSDVMDLRSKHKINIF